MGSYLEAMSKKPEDSIETKLNDAYKIQKATQFANMYDYGHSPEMQQSEARFYPGSFDTSYEKGFKLISGDDDLYKNQPSQIYDRLRDKYYETNVISDLDEYYEMLKEFKNRR